MSGPSLQAIAWLFLVVVSFGGAALVIALDDLCGRR